MQEGQPSIIRENYLLGFGHSFKFMLPESSALGASILKKEREKSGKDKHIGFCNASKK